MNVLKNIFGRMFLKKSGYKLPKDYSAKFFKSIKKYKVYNIDMHPYLRNFLKPDNKIKFSDYEVYLVYSNNGGYGNFEGIYHDAKYSFILVKSGLEKVFIKQKALACIGFDLGLDRGLENSIIIKQIQGVSGEQNDLSYFHWTKMLLKICVDWAKDNGFKNAYVIRAKNSSWYIAEGERSKNMFMRYDVTARRSGFKFDKKKKMYFLPLS